MPGCTVQKSLYVPAVGNAYVAVAGGAGDCPYTFMHDLVAGRYRVPWEAEVVHVDGTSCGFAPPTRKYAPVALAPVKRSA